MVDAPKRRDAHSLLGRRPPSTTGRNARPAGDFRSRWLSGESTVTGPAVFDLDDWPRLGVSPEGRFACRQAALGGHGGDVPIDLDVVADAAHERGEAPVACVDGEPARGAIAGVAKRVGYSRR